ncbi:MATE family efflux transporter [Cohnella lubricantis]|uniref:MATE family efflux transporter n=1 Tax=Cohnella lubricantis TaxID=2163172 RepID=A0A841TDC0_9BACL|nr:MATE family efflux transporter [Cohnella lubricantis]MBB6679294.1 MATE family efflux transporter [Cohnella lubricantis]MBP2120397.1 putative MATE family efflux protein [Cohnella lubricantis]
MLTTDKKFTLWALAWPIFLEILLQTLLGSVDTVMVSRISDDAVAVVGFATQLFNALNTLFITIASGAGILIAQRLGSKRQEDARTIAIMAVTISTAIGLVISTMLYLFPRPIAGMLQLSDELMPLADVYISYVGGGMFMVAMTAALSASIRNTGNTRAPMYVGIAINLIHIVLNYLFIFGSFGFPKWGLAGVTVSDNICRFLSAALLLYMFLFSFERRIRLSDFRVFKPKLLKDILKISWPLGINSSCWVLSQLAIYSFLAMLGAKELAARTYMNTLESFCFTLGFAIALAAQIQIAHLYGAARTRDAYKAAYKALFIGETLVIAFSVLLYLMGRHVLGLFTTDPEIISMAIPLLVLNLILQPGKMLNMALGNSLSAVGDTRYIMMTSIASMGLIATGCSYFLGIHWGWGLIGIYCSMIADEYARGILSYLRWRKRKYLRKAEAAFNQSQPPAAQAGASLSV